MKIINKNDENYPKYKAYVVNNLIEIPFYSRLTEEDIFDINGISRVLHFKTNNYVVNQLIDLVKYETETATKNWLQLLKQSKLIETNVNKYLTEVKSIINILTKIVKTSQDNLKSENKNSLNTQHLL